MKLFFILIFIFSVDAFAQWRLPRFNRSDDSYGGLRVVWSCPTLNRGDMPEEREVEISYDDFGRVSFRPDIFKPSMNPIRAIRNLFGRRNSSGDVGECLRSFITSLPEAVNIYQQSQCSGMATLVCTRSGVEITRDTGSAIRRSSFYRKYERDLANVESILSPGQVAASTTAPERVEPERGEPERRVEEPEKAVSTPEVDERARVNLLDYLVDNYSRVNELKEFSQHCPGLGSTPGANASYCSYYYNRNQHFLNVLSQRFTAIRGGPVPTVKMIQALECLPAAASDFRDIDDLLHSLDRKEDCDPLTNIGDYKLFRKQPGHEGFSSGNYLLKKTGENAYEATLNLDFKNLGGSLSSGQMLNKVKNCLAVAGRNIRGPRGEKLTIRALSPSETEALLPRAERPRVGEINIRPSGIAIDSANFTGEADCATITHEVLHHMGLCDEYKETRTDLYYGMSRARSEEWSCRVVPTRPSIMKHHVEAFRAAVAKKFTCECVNAACTTALQGATATSLAHQKILMTANPNVIMGMNASYCQGLSFPSVRNVPEPDKGYVNVQVSEGRLTFQVRSLYAQGSEYLYGRTNYTCQCPQGDASCAEDLERAANFMNQSPQAEECPLHTRQVGQDAYPEDGETTSVNSDSFTVVTVPRMPSLLYPNQFDKILTGSCRTSASSLFKTCSDYAYIPEDSPACSEKPEACLDDDRFLGVMPQ